RVRYRHGFQQLVDQPGQLARISGVELAGHGRRADPATGYGTGRAMTVWHSLTVPAGIPTGTQPNRHPARTPGTSRALVPPGRLVSTVDTSTRVGQLVPLDHVPVPLNHTLPATGAGGGLPGRVMHVARVHVAQAPLQGDPPGHPQRLRRGTRDIHHLEIRMERGEVQRNVRPEMLAEPVALLPDLVGPVVVAR